MVDLNHKGVNEFSININQKVYVIADLKKAVQQKMEPVWLLEVFKFILEWKKESNFIFQNTSGSTGIPKTIQLSKSAMIASAKRTIDYFNLQPNNVVWLSLPIDYIAGKMQVVRCIVGGMQLLVSEPSSLPEIPKYKIDFAALVPFQLKKMIRRNISINNIKKLILGGAATDQELINEIQELPTEIFATYGMTETCSHIAIQRLNGKLKASNFSVLKGIQIHLNKRNCLCITAPDLTPTTIETNDVVEFVNEREFRVVGRADTMINSGGLKIFPEEIEGAILKNFGLETILLGVQDHVWGEKLVLAYETPITAHIQQQILRFIAQKFTKNKTPKSMVQVKKFPRSASLKIKRLELKNRLNKA